MPLQKAKTLTFTDGLIPVHGLRVRWTAVTVLDAPKEL